MKIDIEQERLGTLCICAIRYCQGRQTYMPSLVQSIVKPLLPKLSDKAIGVMLEDCDFQDRMHLYGDETIDKPGWIPVTEQLPEKHEWVLRYSAITESTWLAYINSAGVWMDEQGEALYITHWMPLPQPPKEETG